LATFKATHGANYLPKPLILFYMLLNIKSLISPTGKLIFERNETGLNEVFFVSAGRRIKFEMNIAKLKSHH